MHRTANASQVHDGLTLPGAANVLKYLDLTENSVFVHVGCGTGTLTQLVAHKFGCTTWGVDVHKDLVDVARAAALGLGLNKRCRYKRGGIPDHGWLDKIRATHIWCYDFRLTKEPWLYYKTQITEWSKPLEATTYPPPPPPRATPDHARILERNKEAGPENEKNRNDGNSENKETVAGKKGKGYAAVPSAPAAQPRVESDGIKQLERRVVVSCFDQKGWTPALRVRGRYAEPYNDGSGRVLIMHVFTPLSP